MPSVGAPTYVLAPASAPTIPTSTIFSASAPYSITFSAFLFNVLSFFISFADDIYGEVLSFLLFGC